MPVNLPAKIITPWATSGLKNAIPQTSDPVNGLAGYNQGFPAINMQPKTAGGIPPFGQDFNGIFFDLTQAVQFQQAGGSFPYDATWATAVGGYPIGALVSRSDNSGMWRNTVANNLTNPEAGGAGWQPEGSGSSLIAMAGSNVTLTSLQAARSVIIITGTITSNLQLIFPTYVKVWQVINNASGNFNVTCKTAAGSGVGVSTGTSMQVVGDGTNIVMSGSIGASSGMVTFVTPGTTSWAVPAIMQAGIVRPRVTVIGGGGGAGSAVSSASFNAAGGGGGAGGFAQELIDLTGVASVSVTVGAGGAGGIANGATAQQGNVSSFGAFCSATGGVGGNGAVGQVGNSQVGQGGDGGVGTGGTINGTGGGGQPGVIATFSLAGSTAGSGKGGMSYYSGASTLGAGGTGAFTTAGSQSINGGSGANGCVIIEW